MNSSLIFIALLLISINSIEAVNVKQALALIQQDLAKATETLNHASELLKNERDRDQSERYGMCVEELREAVSIMLPNAAKDVNTGFYDAAIDELKATVTLANNCENLFTGSFDSPFAAQIKDVNDLAFQAINVIKKHTLLRR